MLIAGHKFIVYNLVPNSVHQLSTAVRNNGRLLATVNDRVLKRVWKLEGKDSKPWRLRLNIKYYVPKVYMRCDGQRRKMAYSVRTLTN
jgi:hypothetical protein